METAKEVLEEMQHDFETRHNIALERLGVVHNENLYGVAQGYRHVLVWIEAALVDIKEKEQEQINGSKEKANAPQERAGAIKETTSAETTVSFDALGRKKSSGAVCDKPTPTETHASAETRSGGGVYE